MPYVSIKTSVPNLRKAIDGSDKSVAGIARDIGVAAGTIWAWLKKPVVVGINPEVFAKLVKSLGVNAEDLKLNGITSRHVVAEPPPGIDFDNNARPIRAKIRRVPVFRLLPASRLGGPDDLYTRTQEPDEYQDLPAPSEECLVVQISGDCMEPVWPDGCYAMIDFARTAGEGLVPGAAYYVQLRGEAGDDGKATFKKYVGPDGDVEVFESINKKKYRK